MKSYLTTICAQVEQQLMTPKDLSLIPNQQVFAIRHMEGNFFDYMGTYLFIAKKGGIEDWAIYGLPVMTDEEWSNTPNINPKLKYYISLYHKIDVILAQGMKLSDKDNIRLIVPCTDEMLELYRH